MKAFLKDINTRFTRSGGGPINPWRIRVAGEKKRTARESKAPNKANPTRVRNRLRLFPLTNKRTNKSDNESIPTKTAAIVSEKPPLKKNKISSSKPAKTGILFSFEPDSIDSNKNTSQVNTTIGTRYIIRPALQ